jgi:CDP-diacylglycerol---serine O-phosphatidyltransferase
MLEPKHPNTFNSTLKRRGIYLLPNLFTTAALFAGFYAIVQAMNGQYEQSAIAIFIAMILDGLDGRVARLTRTESAFGAEYDSLSDMVSFGAAPALVIYVWALRDLGSLQGFFGKLGWIAAFLYCVCAALRLARFNTMHDIVDKRYFQGLPSPAAAALIAGFVWVMNDYSVKGGSVKWLAFGITVFAAVSMVTTLPLLVLTFVLISTDPPTTLFTIFVGYALSGYVMWLWRRMTKQKTQHKIN